MATSSHSYGHASAASPKANIGFPISGKFLRALMVKLAFAVCVVATLAAVPLTALATEPDHSRLSVYADQLVTFEYPSSRELETHRDNGVEYRTFSGGGACVQVATVASESLIDPDNPGGVRTDLLSGELDLERAILGEPTYRSVDGVPVASVSLSFSDGEREYAGIMTEVASTDQMSMVISTFVSDAPAETIASVQLLHESISPVEGTRGGFVNVGYGPEATSTREP